MSVTLALPSERRCEACGADISHRRRGARTCDATCRKALSRGAVPPAPAIGTDDDPSLEDLIADRAHERHLAWSAARPDRALIEDLDAELSRLWDELRNRRAQRAVPDFAGHSASVVVLHAPPLPRPWRATQASHREREAVAA